MTTVLIQVCEDDLYDHRHHSLRLDPGSHHRYRNASMKYLPFAVRKSRHPCETWISSLGAKLQDFYYDHHSVQEIQLEYFELALEIVNLFNLLSEILKRAREEHFGDGIERHLTKCNGHVGLRNLQPVPSHWHLCTLQHIPCH